MTYNRILTICQNIYRPNVAKGICIVTALFVVWQIVSGLMTVFNMENQKIPINNRPVQVTPSRLSAVNKGLSEPFFGEYVPKNLNDASIKKSQLNLDVLGILFSTHETDSQVILRVSGGEERTFRVGDRVPGGAVIKRITAEGVLIERNRELESLSLPKNELLFELQAKPLIED